MLEVPAHLRCYRRKRVPECMSMYPESGPFGEPIHHRLDPRPLIRVAVAVDEQLRQVRVAAMASLVTLDRRRQLRCDRHAARLAALGAGVPAHTELDSTGA